MKQETTFYGELQANNELDLRDNRGKRHDMALVLLGVLIGLLRKRDGSLSSIHRSMANTHDQLCLSLNIVNKRVVSRAQLPRLLLKVNRVVFERLLFKHYKIELSADQRKWFAGDGKELRGSIEKEDKRGEVCVQLVSHEDRAVIGQAYYNGNKESEKPCLQQLITTAQVESQQITADALHLHPQMTGLINQAGGVFVIGLKDNQKELLEDMIDHCTAFAPKITSKTIDKGHGRLEVRQYDCFDVAGEYFESRWNDSQFSSLIRVHRIRQTLKTNHISKQTAYYISNGNSQNALQYFDAVRNHWTVEVNNHYRDVSLQEDRFQTKKSRLPG